MQALASSIAALLRLSPYTPQSQSSRSAPPTPPPTLNDDVLLFVLSRSSRQTVASMMATCHFLYHEGAKVILRDWPVAFDSIASEHKTLSLLRFIQAEHFSRCSYVRKLYVSMQPMPDAVAQSLAGLVPCMTSLKSLFLNIEHALESHPGLLYAFASLRSVDDLVLTGGEHSCELIQSLQSHLVSAQLFFVPTNPEARQRLYLTPAFHPVIMLRRSALTLKTLICSFWCDIDPRTFVSLSKALYPNMHTFIFHESRSLGLAPYIKSFPNLAHLTVGDSSLTPRWDSDYAPLAVIQRNMNLARSVASSTGESLSWKQLRDYTGCLVDLWFLGLSCPIPRLYLEDAPTERPPHALTDVLAYARPTELTIAFQRCSLTDVLDTDFLSALRTEGASGLRHLTLLIELGAKDRNLDLGRALEDIVATISRLKLTYLDIAVNDIGLDESEGATGAAERPVQAHTQLSNAAAVAPNPDGAPRPPASASAKPLNLGQRTLDEFDVEVLLSRLPLSIHTLQEAQVSIQSPRRPYGVAMRSATRAKMKRRTSAPAPAVDQMSCKEAECERGPDDWWGEMACGAEYYTLNKL
ncbi:hypothetical protein LXA43DRAFT_1182629 [Ganoderma leucocontextum]|nr:hypothetical protein LXA43DRAFT_1182629 [Ganoderma leucocontextum]